jgi:hypothetical protein
MYTWRKAQARQQQRCQEHACNATRFMSMDEQRAQEPVRRRGHELQQKRPHAATWKTEYAACDTSIDMTCAVLGTNVKQWTLYGWVSGCALTFEGPNSDFDGGDRRLQRVQTAHFQSVRHASSA